MTAHDVARELRDLITGEILGTERSQQTRIGPSQLGTTCTRCLVHGLAETPRGPRGQAVVRAAQQAHHTDDINAIVRRYRLAMQNLPATLDLADEDRASQPGSPTTSNTRGHDKTAPTR